MVSGWRDRVAETKGPGKPGSSGRNGGGSAVSAHSKSHRSRSGPFTHSSLRRYPFSARAGAIASAIQSDSTDAIIYVMLRLVSILPGTSSSLRDRGGKEKGPAVT